MEQIKLDIVPVGVAPVAHASQFDNGRQIRFNLFNQGTPYTLTGAETVTMVVNGEEENITNTSDNYVIWDVAEEDCAEVGVIGCEIRIVLGSMLIGSKNFFLEVEMDPYDGKNIRIVTVGPADICTFETTLPEPYQSVTVDIVATGGNGTPDNPIPINGYSSANITRCGVNLWDEEWEVGGINGTTGEDFVLNTAIRSKGYTPVKGNVSLYYHCDVSGLQFRICYYDANKDFISALSVTNINQAYTTPINCAYVRFAMRDTYGTTYNNDISINYPSTDTTYHAYNGQTYAIAFGQTVYGGVLDVTRGKLHVTKGGVDLGTLEWTPYNDTFYAQLSAAYMPESSTTMPDIICEIYSPDTLSHILSKVNDNAIGLNNGQARVHIYDSSKSSLTGAQFKTAMSGVKAVFKLATPFDIDLTPKVISAIVGTNNVFADCGQTTVKYLKAGA